MQLYDSQIADLAVLRNNNYTGLLNIEPGGGKTVLATAAAVESEANVVLIIAPAATHKESWQRTATSFGKELRIMGNSGKHPKAALFDFEFGLPGWYIITPQFFTRVDTSYWHVDMLIVDEVHQLSRAGSKGQVKLAGFKLSDKPLAGRANMRLALSGTPFRNHFERAWSTCRLLWPSLDGVGEVSEKVYASWQNRRMTQRYAAYLPDYVKNRYVFVDEKQPGRLVSEMPCVVQHFRRRNCCEFHPAGFLSTEHPQVIEEVIPLLPEQKQAIRGLEEYSVAWLNERPLVTDIPIVTQQRVREICLAVPSVEDYVGEDGDPKQRVWFDPDTKSPLIDRMLERLDELDEPVVVFCQSQRFAELAVARFNRAGVSAFEYSGATRATRDESLSDFGAGRTYRVAVIVISAGGTGLDGLQNVCSTEFWAERSLDGTDNTQAEARTDRMGAVRQVQRYVFRDDLGYADARWTRETLLKEKLVKSSTRV